MVCGHISDDASAAQHTVWTEQQSQVFRLVVSGQTRSDFTLLPVALYRESPLKRSDMVNR